MHSTSFPCVRPDNHRRQISINLFCSITEGLLLGETHVFRSIRSDLNGVHFFNYARLLEQSLFTKSKNYLDLQILPSVNRSGKVE